MPPLIVGQRVLWIRHPGIGPKRIPAVGVIESVNKLKQTADVRFINGSTRGDVPQIELVTDQDLVATALARVQQAGIASGEQLGRPGLS